MGDYAHFSEDPSQWEESTQSIWGSHNICPLVKFPSDTGDSARALSPLPYRGVGRPGEVPVQYGVSFNNAGQSIGGRDGIWACHGVDAST